MPNSPKVRIVRKYEMQVFKGTKIPQNEVEEGIK